MIRNRLSAIVFSFFLSGFFLSTSIFSDVSMSAVALATYGTGETGAFFFAGKEHIYADDLIRAKLGIPQAESRKIRDEGSELEGSGRGSFVSQSTGFSFSAISQQSKLNVSSASPSKKHRIVLKDSPI